MEIPVVLTSINPQYKGDVFPEISGLFPDQDVFARKVPSFDAFEDEMTFNAFNVTDRKKLVVSGLGPVCALHTHHFMLLKRDTLFMD